MQFQRWLLVGVGYAGLPCAPTIGVTLATSAAMAKGLSQESAQTYALLQTAGAIATVVILLAIARKEMSLRILGLLSYAR